MFDDLKNLEDQLKQSQPRSSAVSEAELLYRCGWEAALAQQASGVRPKDARWRSFGVGIAIGLAASMMFWIPSFSRTRITPENLAPPVVLKSDQIGTGNIDTSVDTNSNTSQVQSVALPKNTTRELFAPNSEAFDNLTLALSPVTSRQWQRSLKDASEPSSPSLVSRRMNSSDGLTMRDSFRQTDAWQQFTSEIFQ